MYLDPKWWTARKIGLRDQVSPAIGKVFWTRRKRLVQKAFPIAGSTRPVNLLFLLIFNDFHSIKRGCCDQVVPLECLPMLKTCSEGLTCPVTSVVCSYETLFRNISTQIAVLATLILELFPQTSWGAQNPWFWALFETPKIASTQLQTTVENFLEVTWPCYRYSGLTSGYNLSNALTLVFIRRT